MQYPIIDLMADAYLNNGWTGNSIFIEQGGITDLTGVETSSESRVRTDYITIEQINVIYANTDFITRRIYYYNVNKQFLSSSGVEEPLPLTKARLLRDAPENYYYIRIVFMKPDFTSNITPADTLPTINGTFENNISHKLKIPLIKYFPHTVIDALQRAAAGTQTADDTEILRHYLTPLGIGGI